VHFARCVERPAGGIEDVRMASDEFLGDRLQRIGDGEMPSSDAIWARTPFEDQVPDLPAQP
jgi:hypothetical protein